jgi:hypothetical protein
LQGQIVNSYFAAASVLAVLVGLVHSVLGEVLIFRRMRNGGLVPTDGGPLLEERHVRILWASWHVLTALGWFIAAVLYWLALSPLISDEVAFIESAIIVAMLVGSTFVLVGTRGKHPGWIGLLGIAVLVWLGST